MAENKHLIEDTTISSIVDATRDRLGIEKEVIIPKYKVDFTPNLFDNGKTPPTAKSYYANSANYNHVIKMPGATKLTLTIYYATESINYDWLCVFIGEQPTLTANNYSSSLTQKIGGGGTNKTSYTNTKTLTVDGDSCTICFRSDGSGQSYGYYAVIESDAEPEITRNLYTPSVAASLLNALPPAGGEGGGKKPLRVLTWNGGTYNSLYQIPLKDFISSPTQIQQIDIRSSNGRYLGYSFIKGMPEASFENLSGSPTIDYAFRAMRGVGYEYVSKYAFLAAEPGTNYDNSSSGILGWIGYQKDTQYLKFPVYVQDNNYYTQSNGNYTATIHIVYEEE